jgi:glycyl-tRNA synthetase beta chain
MREHQKYFHIESPDGDLLPSFITISNIESKRPESVIYGNEKVIRPRLADAAFFFDTDKETTLGSKARRLESVLFQRDLGTLAQKQARISAVAQTLSEYLGADKATIEAAGGLIKADLVSDMVGEFPELQGIAGRHYALHDGESEAVANAIEQHYWPKFSGDRLPESPESAALALADRLDTLIGIFGIGQVPTGSKDPFALRRASLAVIRILLSFAPTVGLEMILRTAKGSFPSDVLDEGVVDAVKAYLLDRLPAHYEEQGVSVDILRSATAVGTESIGDIDHRSLAVAGFAGSEAAAALAAANKRVANILTKTEEALPSVDETLLSEAAECSLHAALAESQAALNAAIADNDYSLALSNLAKLRDPVDAFFDNVLVNAEDANVRLNRLALLQELRGQFLKVADLAVLAR